MALAANPWRSMAAKMPGHTAVVMRVPIPSRGVAPRARGRFIGSRIRQYRSTTAASVGYAANRQIATYRKGAAVLPVAAAEEPLPIEKVHTPNASTIDALSKHLNQPASRLAKAVFQVATYESNHGSGADEDRFVIAIIRGDLDVNETKLINVLKAKQLRPATDEEIRALAKHYGI